MKKTIKENVVCDTRNNNPYTGVSSTCPAVAGQGSQTCTANFPGDGYAGTCGPASVAPGGGTPTGGGPGITPVRGVPDNNRNPGWEVPTQRHNPDEVRMRKLIRKNIREFMEKKNLIEKERASCWRCAIYVDENLNETGKKRCHKMPNDGMYNGCMSWVQCFKSCRLGMDKAGAIRIDAKTNKVIK